MNPIDDSVIQLETRLPELAWKLNKLRHVALAQLLPQGLFRDMSAPTPHTLLDDVKNDLASFKQQVNPLCKQHIAQKIHQKIAVLVYLCQRYSSDDISTAKKTTWHLQEMSTRQQLFDTLYRELEELKLQKHALQNSMAAQRSANKTPEIATCNQQLRLKQEKEMLTVKEK